MKLSELKKHLSENSEKVLHFVLPTGTKFPLHAHVTDVARIDKKFIDCGGTFRTESFCRLQAWFADDTDHRIGAKTLLKVLERSKDFLETEDLEVDVECEAPFISQFPIAKVDAVNGSLLVHLGIRHTACLAEDKCLPKPTKPLLFEPLPVLEKKCC